MFCFQMKCQFHSAIQSRCTNYQQCMETHSNAWFQSHFLVFTLPICHIFNVFLFATLYSTYQGKYLPLTPPKSPQKHRLLNMANKPSTSELHSRPSRQKTKSSWNQFTKCKTQVKKKKNLCQAVVAHASPWEAEAGVSLSLRPG